MSVEREKRIQDAMAAAMERIEQLEYMLAQLEWSNAERGWLACPDCEGAMPNDPNYADWHETHPKYHKGHFEGCDLARLMTMPEEPKP